MKKTMLSLGCVLVLALGSFSAAASSVAAQDKQDKDETKKLSDRTVRVIMGSAFAGIPESLPKPGGGEMVKIDRSDPKKFLIPLDEAREIIIKAVLTARADLCGLKDLQRKHFESIMRHELARKKWTPHQMTYIDVLHATTGIYMTGTAAVGDDAKKKDDGSADVRRTYNCSADERERVKEAIEADINQLAQVQ